jgi:peroxiredoxin
MRTLILAGVAALAISGAAQAQTFGQGIAIGATAPAVSAKDVNGKLVNLADFKGKTVVLEWTEKNCPFVEAQYKSGVMQKAQAAAKAQNVVWLTVLSSAPGTPGYLTAAQVKADQAEKAANQTDLLLDPDGKVGKAFGAKTTNHMFVISSDQKIAYMGAIDDKPTPRIADRATAKNYVTAALQNLAAGKAPDPASTTPYGCAVEYAAASGGHDHPH